MELHSLGFLLGPCSMFHPLTNLLLLQVSFRACPDALLPRGAVSQEEKERALHLQRSSALKKVQDVSITHQN